MSEKSIESEIAELMYVDPARALALHKEVVKQEIRGEYQQHQGKEKFWHDFYRQYPELKADHDEVFQVLVQHQEELWPMSPADAAVELASRAKHHIKYKEQHRAAERGRSVYVGGPDDPDGSQQFAAPRIGGGAFGAPVQNKSLGDLIKERNAARSQGQGRFNDKRATETRRENPVQYLRPSIPRR
ncbi:hypothetical protein HGP14_02705 [Rhizobium sp. P32RR-XVIII]|uniref:hypothetical protein n=1 Tax=Rhizobium sp. P32RR-XVIII TaxID=2726738 RepID=UPI00145792DB|nr:hypothetical protein [Rhizobium sp. P32RR-XVIII]NLS02279.1 hypothetical protein [Rhizobium sp. P32RR-XVIII]